MNDDFSPVALNFCNDAAEIWYTVGMFLLVFKIVIPLILIILGMIDLGKAVISSDEKAVSKSAKSLLNRVIAGVCIFFIPTLIGVIFNVVGNFTAVKDQYDTCAACITKPNKDVCRSAMNNSGKTTNKTTN